MPRKETTTMEQKEDIFYDNAAEFSGISEEETAKHKKPRHEISCLKNAFYQRR